MPTVNNKKLYPFARNNYFYGKLLTARDFEDEQRYLNDKRRLNNIFTAGAGVLAGMQVVLLNDKTVSIEAGFALDYLGREMVIEESVTKKINVLAGYETIQGDGDAFLCIEYAESMEDSALSIHAAQDAQGQKAFNKIREGYTLSLTNSIPNPQWFTMEGYTYIRAVLYEDSNVKITHSLPRFVQRQDRFALKVSISKKQPVKNLNIDFSYTLGNLKTDGGQSRLNVTYADEGTDERGTITLAYTLVSDNSVDAKGSISLNPEDFTIKMGTKKGLSANPVETMVDISEKEEHDRIAALYLSKCFGDLEAFGDSNKIVLARLRLVKLEGDCFIEDLEPLPFKQHVVSNAFLYGMLERLQSKLKLLRQTHTAKTEAAPVVVKAEQEKPKDQMACGQETIEVDLRSKNMAYFSDEIAHGLGKGDVCITVAVEDIEADSPWQVKKSILGDAQVFEGSHFEPTLFHVKTGVLSYTDKGTFRIGVRFGEDSFLNCVKVKWWAVKKEMVQEENLFRVQDVTLRIEPNTIMLPPRGKCRFEMVMTGAKSNACKWSVSEANGGIIDSNGVYEAPSVEGVFEVVAESVRYPGKTATAFVVVKEK